MAQPETETGETFLPEFQWVYCDVVCANDFRNKGPIQQDGQWMMIVWFIVTEGRAPNADECRNSLCFQRKIWMMRILNQTSNVNELQIINSLYCHKEINF